MKKNEQIRVNAYVETVLRNVSPLWNERNIPIKWKKLYQCSAEWGFLGGWLVVLKSYSTIVCVYNPDTNEIFDFLRLVYGYTATSAQHIAKFRNFCRGKFGKNPTMYRWYAV